MKNRKGFTLVELLAIIVILGIIVVMVLPQIGESISYRKQRQYENIINIIKNSAKAYNNENKNITKVSLRTLESNKYLTSNLTNPITEQEMSGCIRISRDIENVNVYDYYENPECNTVSINLTVNLNGGSITQSFNTTYDENTVIDLSTPTKAGSDFSGWEVVEGNSILNGDTLIIGSTDTVLYAMWGSFPTLTVNLNGGSTTQVFDQYYQVRDNIILTQPTRTGYTFTGWTVTKGNSLISGNSVIMGSQDTTITANWTVNTYTINYYQGNGTSTAGTKLLGTSTCTYNSTCTLKTYENLEGIFPNSSADNTATGNTNYNWSFNGWSTTQTGTSIAYSNGGSFTYGTASNLNLYAVGRRNIYFNSGIAPTDRISVPYQYWNPYSTDTTYVTGVTVPTQTAIGSWTFLGYVSGSNSASSNVTLAASTVGTSQKLSPLTSSTFRSVYSRTLTVSYNANSGSGTTTATTKVQYYNSGYGDGTTNTGATLSSNAITLASNSFTRTGYKFTKWAEGSASGTQYAAGASYSGIGTAVDNTTVSKTMYAVWELIPAATVTVNGAINEKITYTGTASGTITLNGKGTATVTLKVGSYTFKSDRAFTTDFSTKYSRTFTVSATTTTLNFYPAGSVYWFGNGAISGSSLFSRCGGISWQYLDSGGTPISGTYTAVNTSKDHIKVNTNNYRVSMTSSGGTYYSIANCVNAVKTGSYTKMHAMMNSSGGSFNNGTYYKETAYRITNAVDATNFSGNKHVSATTSSITSGMKVQSRVYTKGGGAGNVTVYAIWQT